MKPDELKEYRLQLGYSTRMALAEALAISTCSIDSWEEGLKPIPHWLSTALIRLGLPAEMAQNLKREILRDRVVDLVKIFINTEGPLDQSNLQALFGPPINGSVAYEINKKSCD